MSHSEQDGKINGQGVGYWHKQYIDRRDRVTQLLRKVSDLRGWVQIYKTLRNAHKSHRRRLETELSEMAQRFSCVLEHATGGRMSKTNIVMEQMRSEIDDYAQEFIEGQPEEFAKVEKELNEKIGLLRRDLAEWLQLGRRQYAEMNHSDGICPTLKGINDTEKLLNVPLT